MAGLLQTEDPRRRPAAYDGGHHDGDINLLIFIDSRIRPGDPPIHADRRNTFDPPDQTPHHALHRLIQFILLNSFRPTTTFQPMA